LWEDIFVGLIFEFKESKVAELAEFIFAIEIMNYFCGNYNIFSHVLKKIENRAMQSIFLNLMLNCKKKMMHKHLPPKFLE